MNTATYTGLLTRFFHRLILRTRYLNGNPICESFDVRASQDSVQRIYVINLDRQQDRWQQMERELRNLCDRSGKPLVEMTRRFSAVDARYMMGSSHTEELYPYYSLADQLFVEPNSLLEDCDNEGQLIEVTRQEAAIALSHLAIWRTIAQSNMKYTLILEDDVYFCHGFAQSIDRAWVELSEKFGQHATFDLFYLSFMEARTGAYKEQISKHLFKPRRGLWQLSGYVLSARGAKKLLDLLPVRGPVDLWINQQFENLEVVAAQQPIIEQRSDCPSTNSYSILPILSRTGVITREKPLLFSTRTSTAPVFAFGEQGSGLTALAMALSMLGYRCCSDMTQLPESELDKLLAKKRGRIFDAYVNIGSLKLHDYLELAKTYRQALFIVTTEDSEYEPGAQSTEQTMDTDDDVNSVSLSLKQLQQVSKNVLILPKQHNDKWELLCRFLGCTYPTDLYPQCKDQHQRQLTERHLNENQPLRFSRALKSDSSPWIVPQKFRDGILLSENSDEQMPNSPKSGLSEHFGRLDQALWILRDDTFPSNLALFKPDNFAIDRDSVARLMFRKERTSVREYTSAALCTQQNYLYGRFVVNLKPTNLPGLITGIFLHRNSPRQEIDIEFIGKDTTKLLINVYYNPGCDGARMEYGYRGTPVLIDLGFDASENFHRYEIEWNPVSIRWHVDEQLVYERANWDPTPIPHLPMQLNINLWTSKSVELAGRLVNDNLPTQSELRAIDIVP